MGQVPVKVGVDSRDIGAVAGDIHAASLVGCVERHVDRVQEQVSNGEHIIRDVEGCPVLDADAGLDGVHSASQPTGSVGLQWHKQPSCYPNNEPADATQFTY